VQAQVAVIARGVRLLWLGSLATLRLGTGRPPRSQDSTPEPLERDSSRTTTSRYSFNYANGTQVIQDTCPCLEFSTDRAARRAARRIASEMASNVSWKSSARGVGWSVVVIDPMGQQICNVLGRFRKNWFS
jgi:hypothetical protein